MTFLLPSLLASHGGFGFNLNPFETNIINLAIVIAGLWKFLPGFLGSILEQDLSAAQQKAEQIRADGLARAQSLRLESEKRTIDEMARLKQGAMADLNAEAARVTDQLRREAANRAIAQALATLPGKLNADAQARLIDQSISTLGKA